MYDRIVLPTDGSPGMDRVIEHAMDLAETCGATVHALYVLEGPGTFGLTADQRAAIREGREREGHEALERVEEAGAERGVRVVGTVREGDPATEITGYAADEDCDLIVIGTHARRGLSRALLGSVADAVVRTSEVPVTTVRVDAETVAVPDEAAARRVATAAMTEAGFEARPADEPYRERSTWVVPMRTDADERFNVHVDAMTGDARPAQLPG